MFEFKVLAFLIFGALGFAAVLTTKSKKIRWLVIVSPLLVPFFYNYSKSGGPLGLRIYFAYTIGMAIACLCAILLSLSGHKTNSN